MKKLDHYRANLEVLSTAGQQDLENEFVSPGGVSIVYVAHIVAVTEHGNPNILIHKVIDLKRHL